MPERSRSFLFGALAALAITGCGEEVGRVTCDGAGALAGEVTLEGGRPAALWTDLDVAYDDGARLRYDLAVVDATGAELARCEADPTDVATRMNSYRSDIGGHHVRRYLGKLRCDAFEVAETATIEIRGALSVQDSTPPSVALERCHVVVRQ